MMQVQIQPNFDDWRGVARRLLTANIPPDEAMFVESGLGNQLLPNLVPPLEASTSSSPVPRVPREFLEVAQTVACHTDSRNWDILYRVLWRLTHGEPHLLKIAIDDDV